MKISVNEGFDFIHSEYGVFTKQMMKYNALRGVRRVAYLVELCYTADRSKWSHVTDSEAYYKGETSELPIYVEVSNAFSVLMREALMEVEISQINFQNSLNDATCASHDYCDANALMLAAFKSVIGVDADVRKSAHVDAMNTAWILSKRSGFDVDVAKQIVSDITFNPNENK